MLPLTQRDVSNIKRSSRCISRWFPTIKKAFVVSVEKVFIFSNSQSLKK
jgi:hypothetical protein